MFCTYIHICVHACIYMQFNVLYMYMYNNYCHSNLSNLMIGCDTANEAWPKPLRNVISHPESPHGRLIETVDVHVNVVQRVVRLGVVHLVRHEGGDDDLRVSQLKSHFELLQELNILLPQSVGRVFEEVANLTHTWTERFYTNGYTKQVWACVFNTLYIMKVWS